VERFLFARRVSSRPDEGEVADRRDDRTVGSRPRSIDKGRAAVRILEQVADVLFERARR
jgi:hypothetical protein